jgi:hypothetical protein
MNPEVQRTFNRKGARTGAQSSPPCSFNSLMRPRPHTDFHHLKITEDLSRQWGAPQTDLPPHWLSAEDEGPNSRERVYSLRLTFQSLALSRSDPVPLT